MRRERGLTQVQLAKKARVSQSTVSHIEGGGTHINFFVLYSVARALGWVA